MVVLGYSYGSGGDGDGKTAVEEYGGDSSRNSLAGKVWDEKSGSGESITSLMLMGNM